VGGLAAPHGRCMTLNASLTQVPTGHGNRAIDDHSPEGIALRTSRRDNDPDRL
jgi:hypothetical protein